MLQVVYDLDSNNIIAVSTIENLDCGCCLSGVDNYNYINIDDEKEISKLLDSNGCISYGKAKINPETKKIKILKTQKECITVDQKKESIKSELLELDQEVPRIIEDIIDVLKIDIHESKLNIIKKKKALRKELNEL